MCIRDRGSSEQSSRDSLCLIEGQEQTGDSQSDDAASEVTTEAGNRIQNPYLSQTQQDRVTKHRPMTPICHRVRKNIQPTAAVQIRLQTGSALTRVPHRRASPSHYINRPKGDHVLILLNLQSIKSSTLMTRPCAYSLLAPTWASPKSHLPLSLIHT